MPISTAKAFIVGTLLAISPKKRLGAQRNARADIDTLTLRCPEFRCGNAPPTHMETFFGRCVPPAGAHLHPNIDGSAQGLR